jgi:hypothetical protein
MESFTLGHTPKIDFSCSAATVHLQWLEREEISFDNLTKMLSKLLWNSIPNSCSSQCPRASIYRLRVQMGDCINMYGRRPDGQLCDQNFWDFRWKSFLFETRIRTVRHCSPDGRMFAASNFHIRLRASGPRGMAVRTVDLQDAISISVVRASGPR